MNPDNGHPSCLFLALSSWYAVCVFAGLGYKLHHLGPACRPSAIPNKHTKQAIASLNPSCPLQSRIYLEAIRIPISLDPLVVTGGPAGAIPNISQDHVCKVCLPRARRLLGAQARQRHPRLVPGLHPHPQGRRAAGGRAGRPAVLGPRERHAHEQARPRAVHRPGGIVLGDAH